MLDKEILETINLIIIIAAGLLIIYTAFVKRDKNLVTVIGILGTFIGIILGLVSFNVSDIEGSISTLLDGLKTAFITSIFGLFAALILGFIEKDEDDKEDDKEKSDGKFLIEIRDELKKLNSKEKEIETKDTKYDEEILFELRKLNFTNNELKNSFSNFAQEMSENSTKTLVDAIGKVMENFNSKINDQLGESFKDLSHGIQNLLVWQEQYKENIGISNKILNDSKESLVLTSESFEKVVEHSKYFVNISQNLGNELKHLNQAIQIIKAGGNEFKDVAFSIKDMSNHLLHTIEGLTKSFVGKAEIILGENEKQVILMNNTFGKLSSNLIQTHTDILFNLKDEIENNYKFTSNQFLKIQQRLEQQVKDLDKQLGEELEKSLHSLGEQLTGLSGKFVSDYGSLAEKLEKLVK